MAHSLSARKRARQAGKRRLQNASARSMFRTQVRKVLRAIQAGDKDSARQAYGEAVSVIDKTASKGLIHKNKAARHKSRLSKRVREMA